MTLLRAGVAAISRNRRRTVFGLLVTGIAILLQDCKPAKPTAVPDPNSRVEVAMPAHGIYTGAFIDFGDEEDDVSLDAIEEFENLVGKHQAIIASSSYWGEQSFPAQNLNIIWQHGSLPLVFWSPWDRPYKQNHGPDRFSLSAIVEGKWDAYIDQWADGARQFGKPMLVSFANEMNGNWFPWSGWFYGANKLVNDAQDKWAGPERFKQAYRYVVDRLRARGATNVQWVFHVNNYSYPVDTWNFAAAYYPGPDYCDWLGLSVYGQQFKNEPWVEFEPLIEWPYEEICRLDPQKPILIAEWGVGEFPESGDKAEWISEGLELLRTRFPRIKGAVYWHERWQNQDETYSNLRVNSSVEALEAYRNGVASPEWLGELILRPTSKNPKSQAPNPK